MFVRNATKIYSSPYRHRYRPSRVMILFYLLAGGLFCLAATCPVKAATYYCDPVNGNTVTGNGSSEHPWGTLMSATKAGKFNGVMRCRHTCM
jgi:hypothetical protein